MLKYNALIQTRNKFKFAHQLRYSDFFVESYDYTHLHYVHEYISGYAIAGSIQKITQFRDNRVLYLEVNGGGYFYIHPYSKVLTIDRNTNTYQWIRAQDLTLGTLLETGSYKQEVVYLKSYNFDTLFISIDAAPYHNILTFSFNNHIVLSSDFPPLYVLLIPMYFSILDDAQYNTLLTGLQNPYLSAFIIINPNSGITDDLFETYKTNPVIQERLKELRKYAKLFGYVPTGYAKDLGRLDEIKHQIDLYKALDFEGIFFDECYSSPDMAIISYYKEMTDYAHKLQMESIGNFGVSPIDSIYWVFFDYLVAFENSCDNFSIDKVQLKPNTCVIIHSCSDYNSTLSELVSNTITYFYITDRDYIYLPSYFTELCQSVSQYNADLIETYGTS